MSLEKVQLCWEDLAGHKYRYIITITSSSNTGVMSGILARINCVYDIKKRSSSAETCVAIPYNMSILLFSLLFR